MFQQEGTYFGLRNLIGYECCGGYMRHLEDCPKKKK